MIDQTIAILGANLLLSAGLFVLLWLMSIPLKDPSFIDSWWALGIAVLAAATYAQLAAPGAHAFAIVVLAVSWGLRLGVYLFLRWRGHGKDRRYESMRRRAEKSGLNFALYSLLWVFGPQLLLQFVVALPAMLGQIAPAGPLGPIGWTGAGLSLFGIVYENIADTQLARFKRDPANAGKVMDRGVWRYSRHPNYFGDMCAWWGIYLVAAETGLGAWSLPGPLLLTFLLTRVSGAPTTEPHLQRTRPEYEAYKARTSAFIPWPPKSSTHSSP